MTTRKRLIATLATVVAVSGLALGLGAPAAATSADDGVRISSAPKAAEWPDTAKARFNVPIHVRPDRTSPIAGHLTAGVTYKVGGPVKGVSLIPWDCGTGIEIDQYRIVYDVPGGWTGYAPTVCIY